jgi:hypothetical protein
MGIGVDDALTVANRSTSDRRCRADTLCPPPDRKL